MRARKIFSDRSQNFFARARAKRVTARQKFFTQAVLLRGSRHAESIKNERISAK
jgi:hypothetical protein